MPHRRDGPLIVQSDKTVLLDVHHPEADLVRENLGSFAELVKSPDNLHTYRISNLSLWNAAAAGRSSDDVIEFLTSHARHALPKSLAQEIASLMGRFGRLILKKGESGDLLLTIAADLFETVVRLPLIQEYIEDRDPARSEVKIGWGFRGELKRALVRAGYPVEDLAGYEEGDHLAFKLRATTPSGAPFSLRSYQASAALAFFQDGNHRGGNGVVVLPCGAGKTVVGIAVMEMYQTKTLVLTNNRTSVRQWIREVLEKTDLPADKVGEYSADQKTIADVTVSTYQMLTHRSPKTGTLPHFETFLESNWGLVVYDEVHLLPAPVFRVTAELQARRRLGLTATLVREDGREDEVFSLIGPKRFEMPWRRLERGGFIASARCVEMRVPMTERDRDRYELVSRRDRYRIAAENPLKLRALTALLEKHRGDRVLVIGLYLRQLAKIQALMDAPMITSKTTQEERERLYADFRTGKIDRLIVSKVANFAVDLPDANIAIQVSGTFGSRQEEAQRLGRILRPKAAACETVFYTLVSSETSEETFNAHRQLFLTEQGYSYEITSATVAFPDCDWRVESSLVPAATSDDDGEDAA